MDEPLTNIPKLVIQLGIITILLTVVVAFVVDTRTAITTTDSRTSSENWVAVSSGEGNLPTTGKCTGLVSVTTARP